MTSQVNLNQSPYYDDYLASKNYHQVLFKPGYAVQARELTQMQTMLQEQIRRFGDNMYLDGTTIFGMNVSLNVKQNYVKVTDQDANSATINNADLINYIGRYLVGRTSGVRGLVKYVSPGLVASKPDLKTFYIDYVSSGTSGLAKSYTAGEVLEIEDDTTKTFVIPADVATYFSLGKGSFITVDDGIVYADGNFVLHSSQTLPLEKYSTLPSFKVGYRLAESIVNVDGDLSLLDPAHGSFNYAAPGADRLKIVTVLSRIAPNVAPDNKFYLLYEIQDGQVLQKYNKTQYGQLRKELARRTYDEAGNYTVRPFPILVREHLHITNPENGGLVDAIAPPLAARGGNKDMLAIGIEAGKAYVGGFEYETFKTEYVLANKGTTTQTYNQQIVSTAYGNYFTCNEVCGNWDLELGSTVILAKTTTGLGAITGGNWGDTSAPSGPDQIGTARVHAIEYVSGTTATAAALYNIYLYDIVQTSGTLSDITALYQATGKCFADVVVASGLQESAYNDMLFRVPAKSIKTFAPGGTLTNNYVYRKKITGTIANGGSSCTLTLPSDEIWDFSEITPTILSTHFYATINNATGSVHGAYKNQQVLHLQPIADAGSGIHTVTYDSNIQLTVGMGETFASGATLTVWVHVEKKNVRPILKSVKKHRYVKIDTHTHSLTNVGPWDLGLADVFAIEGIWAGTYSGATPGTYLESNTDVTDQFTLNNGQRDNVYKGATLSKAEGATISFTDRNLLVKLSYFTHDYTTGGDRRYMSVDSYPVDDTGLTPDTSIYTWEIPTFTSPTTGTTYDLRDSIDFRARVADVATDTTVIASATINPTNSTTYSLVSASYDVPIPTGNFTTDVQFYMGRIDRIVMDEEGNFVGVTGTASLTPLPPGEQDHTMSLALITIPPYPSLSPQAARNVGRPEFAVSVRTLDNRRYTMRDIGTLEQRINRLEYYTSLSLLEKAAADTLIPTTAGVDRFKNGILVDSFTGHNVGNVYDADYHCAIDITARELRPFFNLENTDLILSPTYSSGYAIKPSDSQLFVTTSNDYTPGETVSIIGASGKVVHNVRIDGTHVKVYVENVTGTFTNTTLSGATSGTTGTITSSIVPQDGHLATLPYTHTVLAQNKFASKPRNVVSQLLFAYNGELTLDPPQDTWTDVTTKPDVQVNFDGNLDAWETLPDAWGTSWGDWQTNWQGTTDVSTVQVPGNVTQQGDTLFQDVGQLQTTTTTQRQTRQGVSISVTPETQVQRIGAQVLDTSIVPFMRSITVSFVADRLKPNTVVYPFFDGEPVTTNCRPMDTSLVYTASNLPTSQVHPVLSAAFVNGAYGATLKTDSNGRVAGQFTIPAGRFRVGNKPFRLCDDDKNRSGFITTAATENFASNGLAQNVAGTVISTRVPRIVATTVSDSRNVQDTTTTAAIVGQRTVGVIQNTTVNNTYNTINNTTTIVDNTIVDHPAPPVPPCADCNTGWEVVLPPVISVPEVWGIDTTPPVVEIGPPPSTTGNETITAGVVSSGGGGGGFTQSVDTQIFNGGPTGVNWQWENTDPTAQTFFVQDMPFGTFISKLDLYFRTKSATLPITVQIREVVNGYPGNTIVPFGSCTLYPSAVNVSEDATVATEFAFPSPVYLQNNTEYCLVLLPAGNNPEFNVWVSELGADTIGTVPVQRISEQPFSGVLFVSANNNTWTALQAEDLKFTLYRADFAINALASVFLKNAPIDYLNVTLTDPAATITAGDIVVESPSDATGIVQSYDSVAGVAKVYVTSGTFTDAVGGSTLRFGAAANHATLNSIEKKLFNTMSVNVGYVDYTPTLTTWGYRSTSPGGTGDGVFNAFTLSKSTDLAVEKAVYSYSAEVDILALPSAEGSLMYRTDFYTKTSTVSPVLDLRKSSVILVANDVNNVDTGETASGGSAASKYISRQVVLDEGQDAEDIVVYTTQNTPAGASVEVYAKLLNGGDGATFASRPWILLSVKTSPTGTQAGNTYGEWQYGLPASVLTGAGGAYKYTTGSTDYTGYKTFAVKVVLLSNSTSIVPKLKDLRVIALQV